tara:strand:- start:834 stop:935 length:102 start_codon:yes stop_codon:yes gene_type:complete
MEKQIENKNDFTKSLIIFTHSYKNKKVNEIYNI